MHAVTPEITLSSESYNVDENEGTLDVCVLLTSPVRTVVDVIVMLTSGSAEQGMTVN